VVAVTRRVFRYIVPVDDQPHGFDLVSNVSVLSVAAVYMPLAPGERPAHVVEFWAEDYGGQLSTTRRAFQVFGTGHDLPDRAQWRGTCDRTAEGLVWHLYEVTP
jgi:hypothetical protein